MFTIFVWLVSKLMSTEADRISFVEVSDKLKVHLVMHLYKEELHFILRGTSMSRQSN